MAQQPARELFGIGPRTHLHDIPLDTEDDIRFLQQFFSATQNQRFRALGIDTNQLDVGQVEIIDADRIDFDDLSVLAKGAVAHVNVAAAAKLPRQTKTKLPRLIAHCLLANVDPIGVAVETD
ncbi:hypothetical protein D3C86_1787770 [compost metagenome]